MLLVSMCVDCGVCRVMIGLLDICLDYGDFESFWY